MERRRSPAPPPLPTLFLSLISLVVVGMVEHITGISDAASTTTTTISRCHASERKALMEFKRSLRDPSRRLSSWAGEDCCAWEGVGCSNLTSHVIQLDLRNQHKDDPYDDCSDSLYDDDGCEWALQGEISDSLLSLQHLRHLDLSANFFPGKPIPKHLGSLRSLTYLNLSSAGFTGRVPDQLGNLSHLNSLDLSYNTLYDEDGYIDGQLYLKDAGWISRLTSLEHLKMNWVNFTNTSNWLEAFNSLPHIQVLELSRCELVHIPHSLRHVNFTSLATLDLSYNYEINSTITEWLFNITTLEHLNLRGRGFNWLGVPISIAKLTSLRTLDLSMNVFQNGSKTIEALSNLCKLQRLILFNVNLNDELINLQVVFSNSCLTFTLEELDLSGALLNGGTLPDWLGNMKNLKYLDLSSNSLYGSLPASLGSLILLQYLDLSDNDLNGTIPEGMFGHMKELIYLDISGNSLSFIHYTNLSSLEYLDASTNYLNGMVLKDVLQHMKGLVELYLRYSTVMLSEEHFANLPSLKVLDIPYTTLVLNESFEDWIPPFQLRMLDMFSCKILPKPQIPKWIRTQRALSYLDISRAGIQGNIPNWLPTTLQVLSLSNNQISGHLPSYLHNIRILRLSNNSFSGQLYSRIAKIMPDIEKLDLSMNNLSGSISSSFCQLEFLTEFQISKNKLWGLELQLPNCWKNLEIMDFSNNKLQGQITRSLCNLRNLYVLHLNNNDLSGSIPSCLKRCTRLQTFDISHNRFTGNIPTWIGESLLQLQILDLRSNAFTGRIPLQLSNLMYLQILDLSNNNLSGIIPSSFGNFSRLKGPTTLDYSKQFQEDMSLFIKGRESEYTWIVDLITLIDLSNNRLIGHIPKELGDLHELRSLNLSKNCLTGEIPSNINGLQKLEVLDLSRNKLSGVIPSNLATLTLLNHLNLSYNNLSGEIPTGTQLESFDSSSYIGNPNLCGFSLSKNCTDIKANGDEEEQGEDALKHKIEIIYLYTSIAMGFIVGFWVICGTLILHRRWRFAYFRYIDNTYDKIYVMVAVKLLKFRRN